MYLLSISIGPVQDFIASARRSRDLWFGSWLLSQLSKAAALAIAELVLAPEFKERMAFRALSPMTETIRAGEQHPSFLSLADDWSEIMQRNLLRKYEVLFGRQPDDTRLTFSWDKDYIASAERRGKRLSVLRDIRGTKIRGWLAPFVVEGSRELIELGYEAGFGARNSMGFGMGEPVGK
jgi:CRISPR-associated endoribonuclease Cas6